MSLLSLSAPLLFQDQSLNLIISLYNVADFVVEKVILNEEESQPVNWDSPPIQVDEEEDEAICFRLKACWEERKREGGRL